MRRSDFYISFAPTVHVGYWTRDWIRLCTRAPSVVWVVFVACCVVVLYVGVYQFTWCSLTRTDTDTLSTCVQCIQCLQTRFLHALSPQKVKENWKFLWNIRLVNIICFYSRAECCEDRFSFIFPFIFIIKFYLFIALFHKLRAIIELRLNSVCDLDLFIYLLVILRWFEEFVWIRLKDIRGQTKEEIDEENRVHHRANWWIDKEVWTANLSLKKNSDNCEIIPVAFGSFAFSEEEKNPS